MTERLGNGYQAVLTKTHHAMLDGVGGMDLVSLLFDTDPEPREVPPPAEPSRPPAWPSPIELALDAIVDRVREPIDAIRRTVESATKAPGDLLKRGADLVRGAA